jgi:hypothetical protein
MPPAPFVLDNIMTKLINIVFLHELAVIASYGDSGPELLSIYSLTSRTAPSCLSPVRPYPLPVVSPPASPPQPSRLFLSTIFLRPCLERMNEKHRNWIKHRNRKGMEV